MLQPLSPVLLPVREGVIAAALPGSVLVHYVTLQSPGRAALAGDRGILIARHLLVLVDTHYALHPLLFLGCHLIIANLARKRGVGGGNIHLKFTCLS